MSYYDDLKKNNLVRYLGGMLKSGAVSLRGSDGKFVANLRTIFDTPWVHAKSDYRMNCFLWKDVTFHEIVEKHLPIGKRFVPAACQDCFKVVVRPKTLKQLFALEQLQRGMDHPSKCGIEIRPSVFGNYGGYFYNRGIEEGVDCYKKVRNAINDHQELGPDVAVILKRGCTEYEHGVGPSDKWTVSEEQLGFEVYLNERFVNDIPVIRQSEIVKNEVRQKWIERAYDIGDETALEFTGGEPLYPAYVTYHHLADMPKNDNKDGETKSKEGPEDVES